MSKTIITGENIFRASTTLFQADIFALDTTPVNLVPAIAGKKIALVAQFYTYNFGTTEYTTTGATAELRYGSVAGGSQPSGTTDVITSLISAKAVSQFKTVAQASLAAVALTTVAGLGIDLVAIATGFAASGGDGTVQIDLLYQVL
jgi:hypothetical protein